MKKIFILEKYISSASAISRKIIELYLHRILRRGPRNHYITRRVNMTTMKELSSASLAKWPKPLSDDVIIIPIEARLLKSKKPRALSLLSATCR